MDNKDAHEMPVAYIAGALNDMAADYIQNVRRMILWGDKVRELGFSVFVPGIDFLCGVVTGNWDYGVAFANSQPFLARADIMSVCPGWEKSSGTAKEIITARRLGIPVYYEDFGLDLLRSRLISCDAYTLFGSGLIKPRDGDIAVDVARLHELVHDIKEG